MTARTTWASFPARIIASTAAAMILLAGLLVAPASATSPTSDRLAAPAAETSASRFEDRILQLLNRDRGAKGLRQLQRVRELDDVARGWSVQQARERRMYHNPSYTRQYPERWSRAGENVAWGYPTPDRMYQAWHDSPGHYRNMFNESFTHIGIGIAFTSDGRPYGTQNFAAFRAPVPKLTPTSQPAPTPTPGPTPAPSPGIPRDDGSSTRNIDDGGVGGNGNEYHLTNGYTGRAQIVFEYGNQAGRIYVGDWNGDGRDTLAYRIGNVFYVRDHNSAGSPTKVIHYGRPGDRVYVGDWDGDGKDTFAVRRGDKYHVKNSMTSGNADVVVGYGRSGDEVYVGDWDGDGKDTFAVRRGDRYFVRNSMTDGHADLEAAYGRSGDEVYVGDWDGDGKDTLAVRRDRTYYIKNAIRGGDADIVAAYGRTGDTTLVGDWSGTGRDGLGIRR